MRGRCVAHIRPIGERANRIGHGSETNGIGHNLRYSENAAHRIIDWPPKSRAPAAATAAAARLHTRRQPVGKCIQDSGLPLSDGQKFAGRRTVAIEDRESIRAQAPATSSAALSTRRTFSPASLARSAPDHPRSGKGGEQARIPRHILQTLGHGLRPHVVTPDADMVDARDLTHVLDVGHDLGQRGDRRWRLLGQLRHQFVVRGIALLDPTASSLGLRLRVPPGYRR